MAKLEAAPVSATAYRSELGVTVGLVDAVITSLRVLAGRDLSAPETVAALTDLAGDEDLAAALRAVGHTLAGPGEVVVRLPAPDSVEVTCGCGIPPDGAPTADGRCRECMEPVLAFFPGGLSVDIQAGAVYDGSGRTFESDAAELQAARLLAAARWYRSRATSPAEPTTEVDHG